jgi:hypothetical protein
VSNNDVIKYIKPTIRRKKIMEKIITDFLAQLKVGRKQSFKNLSIYPLLSNYYLTFDYIMLDEALNQNSIEILEIDKEGSVPDLKVINKISTMTLILDGEELVGAKQNRIVNTTILIPANSTISIPVSCVEQGRWSYDSPTFSSENRIMPPNLRAMKSQQVSFSVRESGNFRSDQGALWEEISQKAERFDAATPSMAMGEIYEKEKPQLKEYTDGFTNIDSQIGAVFIIDGKIAGMDCFGKPETFSSIFKKLIGSYALDAIDWFKEDKEFKVLKSKVTKFLKDASKANIKTHKSVGEGIDCRLETTKIAGFSLCHEDQIPHMSVFGKSDTDKPNSRMQRFSQRRYNTV